MARAKEREQSGRDCKDGEGWKIEPLEKQELVVMAVPNSLTD